MSRPRLGTSVAVGALVAGASAGHVLYPAWLAWRTRGGRGRVAPVPEPSGPAWAWPDLTVLVPAYREAGVIADKVDDLRANGYPGLLRILVIADGDPETAAAAERAGARALASPRRLGKSQALNWGFREADTSVVVISDANNRLAPGALAAVVAPLADPEVGAVAGEKLEDDGGGGESLYWKFESWLKQREDRLGTTIGLVGELSAIRTDAWRPIPDDVAIDDLWAGLDIIEQGYRVAYEPRARALDPATPSLAVQWERRTRNVSGALHVLAPPPPAPAVGGPRGRGAVGASPGPLHREPPLPRRLWWPWSVTKVRSSGLARAFLLANLFGCAGLVASTRVAAPPTEDASLGPTPRHLLATQPRGRVRSCSSRQSPWAAWSASPR